MKPRIMLAVVLWLLAPLAHAQWQLLPGLASDIGVGARGEAWVTGIDQVDGGHSIYRWTGSDWQIVQGGALRLDVDPQGNPWVINSAGRILRLDAGGWQALPGLARDIGIGANGAVWVIGVTQAPGGFTIHRWNGRDWDLVPGGAVRIDADPQGNPWVVNDQGDVLRLAGGKWQRLSGRGTAVTVGSDGTAWLLGSDRVAGGYSVQRWTGQGWRRVPGGAVALAAGRVPWLVNSDGHIYQWQGRYRDFDERPQRKRPIARQ
ncbi:MAG: tectonin domain-containing protein [Burkholderiaceae bacterium]